MAQRAFQQRGPLQIDPFAAGAAFPAPAVQSRTAAPFPQYRETYPTAVSGTVKPKEKSPGETFVGKQYTPEEMELQKFRQAQMDAMRLDPRWTRYFNTDQRYLADYTQYPAPVDTAGALAKKPETIARHRPGIFSQTNRRRLQQAAEASTDPSTHNWYHVGQLEKAFMDELGPAAGREQFRRMFSGPMAATTGGADPRSNLISAYYGNYLRTHGLPFAQEGEGWSMPYPVGGGQYGQVGNLEQYRKLLMEPGTGIGLDNPKRANFQQALEGDPQSFTWDEQMTRGVTRRGNDKGIGVPATGTYGLYEQLGRQEAAKAGLIPAEFQARAWHTFKGYLQGKPMIEQVNEMIERTHRITGMDRDEIVRQGLIYGRIPLFGLAALAYLADQNDERSGSVDSPTRPSSD
jgi:hypothetical protein